VDVTFYCSTCNKQISDMHQTYIGGEILCQLCADKLTRHWYESWGFILALNKDFTTEKGEEERHYG
jgi:DNA-directed RNA polymerase subunit RPC12/RpoP